VHCEAIQHVCYTVAAVAAAFCYFAAAAAVVTSRGLHFRVLSRRFIWVFCLPIVCKMLARAR
jgi:hypothetical protein